MRWRLPENEWYLHVNAVMADLMMRWQSASVRTVVLYMTRMLASLDPSLCPTLTNRPSHVLLVSSDRFSYKKTLTSVSVFLKFKVDFTHIFHIFLRLSLNYEYWKYTKTTRKKHHRREKRDFSFSRNKTYFLSTRRTWTLHRVGSGECFSYDQVIPRNRSDTQTQYRWAWRELWDQYHLTSSWTYEVHYMSGNSEFWLS